MYENNKNEHHFKTEDATTSKMGMSLAEM